MREYILKQIKAHRDMARDNGWFFKEPDTKTITEMVRQLEAEAAEMVMQRTIRGVLNGISNA